MPDHVQYSVVIPLYNEHDSVIPLYQRLKETLDTLAVPSECVFIDDGSDDGTGKLLQQVAQVDSRITVVTMPQNAGKSVALSVGFHAARGDFLITMDGDLQHDPADIPRFMEKLNQGFEIVCGCRAQRSQGFWQRLSNRCANSALAKLTGIKIHDWGGGFKAYRRSLISNVPIYGELQRLIPALALRRGVRVCEIPITTAPRRHGVSKYGLMSKLPVIFDLITVRFLLGYLSRPLHFFGTIGFAGFFAGSALASWLILLRLLHGIHVMAEHGPLVITAAVLILAGIQLSALGLLAEMLVRYHYEDSSRLAGNTPRYVISAQSHGEKSLSPGEAQEKNHPCR